MRLIPIAIANLFLKKPYLLILKYICLNLKIEKVTIIIQS